MSPKSKWSLIPQVKWGFCLPSADAARVDLFMGLDGSTLRPLVELVSILTGRTLHMVWAWLALLSSFSLIFCFLFCYVSFFDDFLFLFFYKSLSLIIFVKSFETRLHVSVSFVFIYLLKPGYLFSIYNSMIFYFIERV